MDRKPFSGQRLIGVAIVIALALAGWFLLRKPALEVDAGQVTRGELTVTADDLGETGEATV